MEFDVGVQTPYPLVWRDVGVLPEKPREKATHGSVAHAKARIMKKRLSYT